VDALNLKLPDYYINRELWPRAGVFVGRKLVVEGVPGGIRQV
jgi:hypothetical protein